MPNGKTVSLKDEVATLLDAEAAYIKAQSGAVVSRAAVNEALIREALRTRHAGRAALSKRGKGAK